MKVFMVNSVCGIKSTGKICTDIAMILESRGDDCRIAYGRDHCPEQYQKFGIRIGKNLSAYFRIVSCFLFDNSGLTARAATKRLIKHIKEYAPDVIHLHNLHGYYLHLPMLFRFLKESKIPVVWTLHDCWSFTGHCSHFDYIRCNKWETGSCDHCPLKTSYPPSLVLDRSKRNLAWKKEAFLGLENAVLVAPSQWLADLTRRSFLGEYPVTVVHNGINLSTFSPAEGDFAKRYGIEGKKILLGVASVWTKRKGLEVFSKLRERLDGSYAIVLVGLDAKQIASLPAGIIGISRTANAKELAEIYTAADLFVNPTQEEVFGLVNVEALACGTPVVTYRTGGCPECLDETAGAVVERDDIDGMEREIRRICEEKPYTKEACIRAASRFDARVCFEGYIDIYRALAEKKK
ncbi:MAG: glycosyltransferase [Clostridia bacterium]|nr:glycosyltransferase [Clostridia bacterium]